MLRNKKNIKKPFSQLQFIAGGFFVMIAIGTLMLMLPAASSNGQGAEFVKALFTATSASCVTGLVAADTATQWSFFGQIIILVLIQIGGLGFISVGVFFSIMLRRQIGLRERGLIMESTNSLKIGGVVKLTRKILIGTAVFEGTGALLLAVRFIPRFGVLRGIWYGVFHSVSAFCNGGFDLMGRHYGEYSSLCAFYDDWLVSTVIMLLIITGGIGFIVWDDIYRHRLNFRLYCLHTKIVLLVTSLLIFGGAAVFYISEADTVLTGESTASKILICLFSSVTARTAGFNTVDTAALSDAGKLLTMLLMFIGGSPGSTAGGIKTTTLFVMLMYVKSNISREYGIHVFGRRIEDEAVMTGAAISTINLGLVILASLIIMTLQPIPLKDVMFEAFSAIGTVGMTTGITRELNTLSKLIIVTLMYLGRVGSLSFALAFTQNKKIAHITQPKEGISVG